MKQIQILSLFCLLFLPAYAAAQATITESESISHTPEVHLFATFVKSLDHNLSLTIEEEIRSAPSHRSHTTLGLGYAPIPYLSIFAGYTLKLYGDQGWTDPHKYLRHRANVSVTGQVKLGQWSLSLREGVMLDARADHVDKREKNNVDFTLRSRLQASYAIPKTALSIVAKVEMLNTLNAPVEYINSIVDEQISNGNTAMQDKYGQYISEWRPELGLQWKINKQHSLSLSYRFNYMYGRNIDVQETGDVNLTHDYSHKHLILLAYKLGW